MAELVRTARFDAVVGRKKESELRKARSGRHEDDTRVEPSTIRAIAVTYYAKKERAHRLPAARGEHRHRRIFSRARHSRYAGLVNDPVSRQQIEQSGAELMRGAVKRITEKTPS
jgi:hypothetical protein